jgi:predicted nucleic acid-binding protein
MLLDTGPLVALIRAQDQFHSWATAQFAVLEPPLLTCEAVITEACFLMRSSYPGQEAVLLLMERGVVEIGFDLNQEFREVQKLITRYQSVPMSLADACLVRMSEGFLDSSVLTLDSDFAIYRKNINEPIPVMMPEIYRRSRSVSIKK